MATQILAVGTGAADSADVVVDANGLTVAVKDAAGPAVAADAVILILLKDDAGQYFQVDAIGFAKPAVFISAAGTYRFSRTAGSSSCGVFSA